MTDERPAREDALEAGLRRAFGDGPLRLEGLAAEAGAPDAALERLVAELGLDDLERYDVLEELGRGGMGIVLRAVDCELGREVAIKVTRDDLDARLLLPRFTSEARITGRLQHPSIVPVHDFGVTPRGRAWMSLRLVEGETLEERLRRRRDPGDGLGLVLALVEAVAQAVAFAHVHGIVHRDLKPSNVMVGRFGEVQVMDWGLARILDETEGGEGAPEAYPLGAGSSAGSVVGTLSFMAPEQARGERDRVDRRADVFALGAILCNVLTGEPPYEGLEGDALRQAAREGPPERARRALEAVPGGLGALALRCLSPEPDHRPDDAGLVAEALSRWRADEEIRSREAALEAARAREQARQERRVRRLVVAAAVAVVTAVAIAALVWSQAAREREERARRLREQVGAVEREAQAHARRAVGTEAAAALEAWDRALEAAARALALAEDPAVGAATRERLATWHRELQGERATVGQGLEVARRRAALRQEVRELFIRSSKVSDAEDAGMLWAGAASGFGVDLERDPAADVREAPLPEVVEFLCGWLLWEREPARRARLRAVIDGLDRDPWRTRIREAEAAGSVEAVRGVVEAPGFLVEAPTTTLLQAVAALPEAAPAAERHGLLRRMWAARPDDWTLNVALVHALDVLGAGHSDALRLHRTILLALDPARVGSVMSLASELRLAGRADEALELVDGALARRPDEARLWALRSVLLRGLGRAEDAGEAERRAVELGPRDPTVLLPAIERAMAEEAWDRARALVLRAIAADLRPGPSRLLLAIIESERGEDEAAYLAAAQAVGLAPDTPVNLDALSRLAVRTGRLQTALEASARLTRLRPDAIEPRLRRARLLLRAERPEEALSVLEDPAVASPPAGPAAAVEALRTDLRAALALEATVRRDRGDAGFPPSADAGRDLVARLRERGLHRLAVEVAGRTRERFGRTGALAAAEAMTLGAASAIDHAHLRRRDGGEAAATLLARARRWLEDAHAACAAAIDRDAPEARRARRLLARWLKEDAFAPVRPSAAAGEPAAWAALWEAVRDTLAR